MYSLRKRAKTDRPTLAVYGIVFDKPARPYIEKKYNDESSIDTGGHLLMLYRNQGFRKKKKIPFHRVHILSVIVAVRLI